MRGASMGTWVLVSLVGVLLLATGLNAAPAGAKKEQLEADLTRPAARVINGEREDLLWRGRYVASIRVRTLGELTSPTCTASIVHKNVVMTAAHCVDQSGDYQVCVNSLNWNDLDHCFRVTDVRIPNEYFFSDLHTHDIALVKVDGDLVNGLKATTIEVDLAPIHVRPNGKLGRVYGFGAHIEGDEEGASDGYLRKIDVEWRRWDFCGQDDDSINGRFFVCADGNFDGSRGAACFGDSGGPLTWSKDGSDFPNKQVLVGVGSRGFVTGGPVGRGVCRVDRPNAYTWIGAWPITSWLRTNMRDMGGRFRIYKPPIDPPMDPVDSMDLPMDPVDPVESEEPVDPVDEE